LEWPFIIREEENVIGSSNGISDSFEVCAKNKGDAARNKNVKKDKKNFIFFGKIKKNTD
jgi:hypothetical protein